MVVNPFNTIKWKLIFIVLTTTAFALILAAIGIYNYTSLRNLKSMEQALVVLTSVIGDRSTAALVFTDNQLAEENLSVFKVDSNIISACLYLENKRLFSAYHIRGDLTFCKDENYVFNFSAQDQETIYFVNQTGNTEVIINAPIMLKGRPVGYIIVHSDMSELRKVNSNILKWILFFSSLALCFAMMFILFLQRRITRPLLALAETADEVAEKGDYSIRAKRISTDETGILALRFNHMLGAIETQNTRLKKQREQLEKLVLDLDYQANHDSLTDLYNRQGFEKRIKASLSTMSDESKSLICYIDLDQFKVVNDTAGHFVGDEMLQQVADILKATFSDHGYCCRMGGDEFVVFINHSDVDFGVSLSNQFLIKINQLEFKWFEKRFPISASIGIDIVDVKSKFNEALMHADSACYAAKEAGRSQVQVYANEQRDVDRRHKESILYDYLVHALEQDKFLLYGQSIINNSDGNTDFTEVLLRLIGSDNVILSPNEFLPLAERSNLILKIDRWVIEKVFQKVLIDGMQHKYFINLSGISVKDEGTLPFIINLTEKMQVSPERICFEITENSSVGSMEDAIDFINSLMKIGFQFALDDFGTGFSNFEYLQKLPVQYIKLDGSLIENLLEDVTSEAYVSAINNISHLTARKTIAEHVSNEYLADKLKELGVDYVQGYYFGKPIALL